MEVSDARKRLPKVSLSDELEREGLRWIEELKIDSHRAEMTLFEAGRAMAAVDSRLEVTLDDLRIVAPLALRQRQTEIAAEFFEKQQTEDERIQAIINRKALLSAKKSRRKKPTNAENSADGDLAEKSNTKNGDHSTKDTPVRKAS